MFYYYLLIENVYKYIIVGVCICFIKKINKKLNSFSCNQLFTYPGNKL